jgi:uncharacterized membrane protein YccC
LYAEHVIPHPHLFLRQTAIREALTVQAEAVVHGLRVLNAVLLTVCTMRWTQWIRWTMMVIVMAMD